MKSFNIYVVVFYKSNSDLLIHILLPNISLHFELFDIDASVVNLYEAPGRGPLTNSFKVEQCGQNYKVYRNLALIGHKSTQLG